MNDFVVSARKYRPSTFNSVVGQSALTTTLKNAIKNNHLAHAYLFCGPRGVGKTTCARIFAKTINCQNLTADYEACNECESCKSFNEQRSYNIHELDGASNNGVDDIRSLIDQVRIPPQVGKYSVYIIDEVHMLSAGAFNAFLKTLEEPPAHAIFILATTEKHKIIPTILSRCQIYDFNRITIQDTVGYLQYVAKQEGVTADANALNIIAQKSDGGMRDALSIFDQIVSFCGKEITYQGVIDNLNVLDYEYYFRLVDIFQQGDVPQALLIFNEVLNKGFDAHQFVSGLSSHFRDVLVSKDPQTVSLLEVGADIGEKYKTQAQNTPVEYLYEALKTNNDCDLNYRQSKNKRLLVELTLIKLCQLSELKKKDLTENKVPLQKITSTEKADKAPIQTVKESVSPSPTTETPNLSSFTATHKAGKETKKVRTLPNEERISIKNQVEQPQESYATGNTAVVEDLNKPFTAEQLLTAWKAFSKTIPEEVRMVNFIQNSTPVMIEENVFEIATDNILQEKELIRLQPDILSFLHQELKNTTVKMIVKEPVESEVQRSLSPEDRYRLMVEKNPTLAKLRGKLNLEID